jgi:hypothetical protein
MRSEGQASASNRDVAVSTTPFNRAIRPTLDLFRSRTAAAQDTCQKPHNPSGRVFPKTNVLGCPAERKCCSRPFPPDRRRGALC